MATKTKTAKKTTSKEKIEFLERQCEQLGKERNQFAVQNQELAIACERLKREVDNLKEAYVQVSNENSDLRAKLANAVVKKSTRNWVLRKLGL